MLYTAALWCLLTFFSNCPFVRDRNSFHLLIHAVRAYCLPPRARHCSGHWGNGSGLLIYRQVTSNYRLSGLKAIHTDYLLISAVRSLGMVSVGPLLRVSQNLPSVARTEISQKNLTRVGSFVWFLAELGSWSALHWGPWLLAAHLPDAISSSLYTGPPNLATCPQSQQEMGVGDW